jgi:Transglycosylase-like domain
MTPTTTPRNVRRTIRTGAIGAVALTAAVALPAFAIDRGGDGTVDAATAAADVESTTTTTTIDPALAAWLDAKAVDESMAALATLTPEQGFALLSKDWTPEQVASFEQMAAQAAELESFYAFVSWTTAQAEAAQASARASTSRSAAPRASGRSVWDTLAQCETGGNWSHPTVSGGFSGGLMFHYATWNANGGRAFAATASGATREQQIIVAERVLANSGWGAWPGCSRKLGLR